MSLNGNNILAGASGQATGYEIERSVVFGDSAYLARTPSSSGNRQVFTVSAWVKLGSAAADDKSVALMAEYTDDNNRGYITFGSYCRVFSRGSGSDIANYSTDAKFRDPSAWYHVVFSIDVTQSTAANRVKIYVNGIQQDITISSNWPEDTDTRYNASGREYHIGKLGGGAGIEYADGYIAEYNFIDGTALDASSFGETNADTNQWQAIKYAGSYGTNGFYLDFATRATDPIDASGNGNNWSSVNVVATDWKIDTPTNNFATLNPLLGSTIDRFTLKEGNLEGTTNGSDWNVMVGNMALPDSGKWYWETSTNNNNAYTGIVDESEDLTVTNPTGGVVYYLGDGRKRIDGTFSSYGAAAVGSDIIGVAVDMDASPRTIEFYKNNVSQGSITITGSCATDTVFPYLTTLSTTHLNFGADSSFAGYKTAQGNTDGNGIGDFYYTPPSGYLALCSANLPDPSIADPTKHFNTLLYTGDGTSSRSFTGVGFQPDLTWIKSRNTAGGGYTHNLYDVARPSGAWLVTSTTAAETSSAGFGLSSFDSDGFTLDGGGSLTNASSITYASWNWKAGGTAVSNTDGSITSSVSANTDAGFSIVSWTGDGNSSGNVGTGLSDTSPLDMAIVKRRDSTSDWQVGHDGSGQGQNFAYHLNLNDTSALSSSAPYFMGTQSSTDGSLLYLAAGSLTSSATYIAYCFKEVDGYSKVGSYTGNGATDGVFVYTGFRPSLVIGKNYSDTSGYGWWMIDSTRANFNVAQKVLYPNGSNAEVDSYAIVDFVSNGFKFRIPSSNGNLDTYNASSDNYIYLAFAESPFKTSNAR